MAIFNVMKQENINAGVERYRETPGAVLLDVRSPQEYQGGHIPGSRNLPLQDITRVGEILPDKEVPLFVYCQSGARSKRAAGFLEKVGYRNVSNLGGIASYSGQVQR